MCRSIKILRNIEPEASDEEVRAAALQFVRKISGYRHPSQVNTEVFEKAVDDISVISRQLLGSLVNRAKPAAANVG
jgi:hypothetical protein